MHVGYVHIHISCVIFMLNVLVHDRTKYVDTNIGEADIFACHNF